MRSLVLVVLVALGSGCSAKQEEVVVAPPSRAAALVDRCIAAHKHSRTVDPAAAYAVIVNECLAVMVKEDGCKKAFELSLEADASARASTVATGCAAAYCPLLGEPKPAICARDVATIAATELPRLFSELFMQVRTHDLGATEAARLEEGIKEIVAHDKRSPSKTP